MISLAAEWAQNARFEDSNFYELLDEKKRLLRRLAELGVFAGSQFVSDLHLILLNHRKGGAPHYLAYEDIHKQELEKYYPTLPSYRRFRVSFDLD